MCGIAGSTCTNEAALRQIAQALSHRGPDGDGIWIDPSSSVGLAHRRLAIIDLSSGGAQPMVSSDGRYVLSYNGEIYNYRSLRATLEQKGNQFHSQSDTEVLLALLAQDGISGLSRLIGMFALALWDRASGELLLARDRFGVKPLVYAPLSGGHIAFASEIAALRQHTGVDLGWDQQALSEYLACLYVPAPATLYRGIRKLPPGHWLKWKAGKTEIGQWYAPRYLGERTISLDESVEELMPLVRAAVRDRLVADVEVGCFLSGGIDSSVVAAIMADEAKKNNAPPPRTFTMTFDAAAYDEREAAQAVAAHIGARHVELPASSRVVDQLDAMVTRFGEPFGNPTALLIDDLSRKAREHVKVALVGDGGDEVFAGYPRYQGGILAGKIRRIMPHWLRAHVIGPLSALIPESSSGRHNLRRAREFLSAIDKTDAEMYASWVEYFDPAERAALLGLKEPPARPIAQALRAVASSDVLDAMQETDLQTFLPGNLLAYGDAMSMAHALELRLPFTDYRLADAVGALSPALRMANGKKTLLKAVARKLLPASIVDRPKIGFNPPMGLWLKNDLAPLVQARLTPKSMADCGLDWKPIAALLSEQASGRRDHSLKIWALLVLDAWRRGT